MSMSQKRNKHEPKKKLINNSTTRKWIIFANFANIKSTRFMSLHHGVNYKSNTFISTYRSLNYSLPLVPQLQIRILHTKKRECKYPAVCLDVLSCNKFVTLLFIFISVTSGAKWTWTFVYIYIYDTVLMGIWKWLDLTVAGRVQKHLMCNLFRSDFLIKFIRLK